MLARQEEADRILALYGDDPVPIAALLERQFGMLHNRAQVLLGLAGVVITTTGFSGRLIAGTSTLAQALIIGGVALVLLGAVTVAVGVLPLRWLTQQDGDLVRPWLVVCLTYRDRKTRSYRLALVFLLLGLALYVGAIAIMLIYPTAFDLGLGR